MTATQSRCRRRSGWLAHGDFVYILCYLLPLGHTAAATNTARLAALNCFRLMSAPEDSAQADAPNPGRNVS